MLKKTITYEDFNGETVTEDHFFHLSEAELVELELSREGGLSETLTRIIAAEDGKTLIAEFKNIILMSYGKRSDDGKRFIKNQQIREEFESSEAYSAFFMELITNTDMQIEFVNGVMPKGLAEKAAEVARNQNRPELAAVPAPEPRIITRRDLLNMPREEFDALSAQLQSGEVKLGDTEEDKPAPEGQEERPLG